MKCFMDAEKGVDKEAVAVCSVCGMGLCMDHVVRHELPIRRGGSDWVETATMQILCETCAKAVHLIK